MTIETKNVNLPDVATSGMQHSLVKRDGRFVCVSGNTLITTDKDGQVKFCTLARDAKLTRDGVSCNAEELKIGSKIRVATPKGDRNVAIRLESLENNADFAPCDG